MMKNLITILILIATNLVATAQTRIDTARTQAKVISVNGLKGNVVLGPGAFLSDTTKQMLKSDSTRFLKNADSTAIRNYSNSIYLKNADSNSIHNYLMSLLVPQTRTLTFNGTSNRLTSSAGAQDLSGNRTWTFDISGSYVGQSSITTLGIISTGGMEPVRNEDRHGERWDGCRSFSDRRGDAVLGSGRFSRHLSPLDRSSRSARELCRLCEPVSDTGSLGSQRIGGNGNEKRRISCTGSVYCTDMDGIASVHETYHIVVATVLGQ